MPAKRECDYIELSDDEHEDMNELSFYDGPPWHPPDIIIHQLNESGIKSNNDHLQTWAVENVVKLLEDECTVPFIARYRREQTNNMEAPVIREIKSSLEELKTVQEKTKTHLDKLAKDKKLTRKLRESLCLSTSILELEQLVAPFKIGSKTTLAERARRAGLEPAADCLLGREPERYALMHYVKPHVEGCQTAAEVEKGVQHIIADIISKDKTSMDELRLQLKSCRHLVYLSVTKANHTKKKSSKKDQAIDYEKFKLYINGKYYIYNVKHHQVLAINRGEDLGALSVKVILPDTLTNGYLNWCKRKWTGYAARSSYAKKTIDLAVDDAYSRLMSPTIIREIRSSLNKLAEKASVDVFGQNLHRLLLTPTVKGQVIMGVDPGFKNGCKLAVISPTGDILHTCVSYMHVGNRMVERHRLIGVLKDFGCQTVGIGNGTACRKTEEFFSQLISSGALAPLDVKYCIVNEDGASIYSVSPDADKEMPGLDVNLRSAVSIARRLQDPLAELVKIEPKHIGVGMYQHDVQERFLKAALADVVEECVSFVGVDLNVCSEVLLKCVAGISANMSKKIISQRKRMGLFVNRQQLLEIKGLGPKTFKQCAGFVRITPSCVDNRQESREVIELSDSENPDEDVKPAKRKKGSAGPSKRRKTTKSSPVSQGEPLDATWIHPESYKPTKELLKMAASSEKEIGTEAIKFKLDKVVRDKGSAFLARCIGVGEPTLQLIIDGLKQPINYDIREEFEKPLFKQGVMSLASLQPGMRVTGRVVNRVHFGVFVDIGVETNGLCHNNKMAPHLLRGRTLGPGDKVEVIVANKKVLESGKVHIALTLGEVL